MFYSIEKTADGMYVIAKRDEGGTIDQWLDFESSSFESAKAKLARMAHHESLQIGVMKKELEERQANRDAVFKALLDAEPTLNLASYDALLKKHRE